MKPRFNSLVASAAAVVVLAAAATLTSGAKPALADTSTGWIQNHWLKAVGGGGCAYWSDVFAGTALRSGACGISYERITYRIITRTNGQQVIQIADPLAGVDLTVNGGTWRWETADSNNHVFPLDQFSDGNYLMFQGDHFMGPNGNGLTLKDITPIATEAQAGWNLYPCQAAC